MTDKKDLAAACGLYCGYCEYLGDKCRGCGPVQGKPFWTEQYGVEVCPLYDCSVNQKKLEHCGLCPELPCETFNSLRDPSLNDEEAGIALEARKEGLVRRQEIGTEAWVSEKAEKEQ